VKKLLILCLAVLVVAPAFAAEKAPTYIPETEFDATTKALEMESLHSWLSSYELGQKAAFDVEIPAERMASLKAGSTGSGPLLVGVSGDVGVTFNPAVKSRVGSSLFEGDNMVWSGVFRSQGATGVRLQLENVDLPEGGELYAFGRHGHAFGPYTGKHKEFWTNTVAGEEIVLQLHLPVASKAATAGADVFTIAQLTHMGADYKFGQTLGTKAFCSWNDTCIQNAECSSIPSAIQPAQNAVAYLIYNVGSSAFICSGGLLNDTASSGTPYLLTANHCFSTQASATSLEAYFQWTVSCGSSCGSQYSPPGSVPRVNGSTLLATSANSDFTFVELNSAAPAGSVFLGWNTASISGAGGTPLYRLSHPKGSPQAYSEQSVNATSGVCGTIPRPRFIYSDATLGDSEGGSSGSPVLNASGEVVGQLFGACGASPSTTCDSDDRTVDGALSETYPSIEQWLDPGSTPPPTGGCTGNNVWTGTATSGGGDVVTPNCSASGTFTGDLVCDTGSADLDLYLDKRSCSGWFGCSFSAVASSTSVNCDESISTSQSSGTYRWRVRHYSGPDESFTLCTNQC